MKLKVAWRKVLRRVLVELGSVFRLRALWAKCHPNKPMQWFSLDFNNAGASNTPRAGAVTPQRCERTSRLRENATPS